ncbi:hypothetical protein HORIV_41080 [Vreelandella olivaria]|uniref:Uncharacterized protein n=1 Tax=Vreelandella olivaria TaxID=390919 RepID=A0ABN5WY03_9GAMM|nr:hypothetical protein HORIV_41080 [Halomonas olivaria]
MTLEKYTQQRHLGAIRGGKGDMAAFGGQRDPGVLPRKYPATPRPVPGPMIKRVEWAWVCPG